MKNKKGRNLTLKSEVIHIRLTKKLKKDLQKEAKNSDCGLSDYIRIVLSKRNKKEPLSKRLSRCTAICQSIINHIEEKYSDVDNSTLEGMVEELWETLC